MEGNGRSSRIKKLIQSAVYPFGERVAGLFGKRQWAIDTFPVRVVITGIEHSGTTLLSTLLKQDSRLRSGFECGFLLADCPQGFRNVHPWFEWMQEPVSAHQWGVSAENMEYICSSETWEEAYLRLMKFSPVFDQPGYQQVCDKTPRYLSCLDRVLDKLPDCIPCLVIEKDIANLWRSHKKRNSSLADFCRMYAKYNIELRKALATHGDRIYRVQYEALCNDLHMQLKHIFSIVRLPFQEEYASSRYDNIQQYLQKQIDRAEPLTEEEEKELYRLRTEFADLFN